MADRIITMRKVLFDKLIELKTPGTWNHVVDQIGMFSYTGLSGKQSYMWLMILVTQCKTMTEKFHIYLTENGRISIAGLNTKNIDRFATALDWVVRNVQ